MYGKDPFFFRVYNMIALFGEAYSESIIMLLNAVFRRPLRFAVRKVRRLIRLIFRCLVMFFAPSGTSSSSYADDVTRAGKRCFRILFSHPLSLPSVIFYYIKKALGRYEYSLKNVALWVLPLMLTFGVLVGINILSEKTLCLEIAADGEILGFVADESSFIEAKNSAREILLLADKEASLPVVTYSLAIKERNSLTGTQELRDSLLQKSTAAGVAACGVFVDGSLLCAVESESQARAVIEGLLDENRTDGSFVVSFAEEIEFRQGLYAEKSVLTADEFLDTLSKGEAKVILHNVTEGDTPATVAAAYNMTEDGLLRLNGLAADTKTFAPGSQIKVLEQQLRLTLKEVRAEVTNETVDFERVEIKTNALYSGSERVLLAGQKGYDQVTSLVTFEGGKRVSSQETSRLSVTKPVSERVQIGIKPLDEAYSNTMGGIFLWPIIGAYGINSDYGYRWGKLHGGIDLGMGNSPGTSLGKPIIAVAQGTVVLTAVHSSYGYYVIIDHGGGLQTLYAHCLADSFMVIPGQIVAAGEPIARVGSTGFSTGPHLHLEVRVNGNRVNPRPYLGI